MNVIKFLFYHLTALIYITFLFSIIICFALLRKYKIKWMDNLIYYDLVYSQRTLREAISSD